MASRLGFRASWLLLASIVGACSNVSAASTAPDATADSGGAEETGVDAETGITDAAPDVLDDPDEVGATVPAQSAIRHVVIVVQENHTFDNHFGRYCTAAPGSNPTCTTGPACCEAAPMTDPAGVALGVLNDATNAANDPDHTQACELAEMNGGAMDKFSNAPGCGNPDQLLAGDSVTMATYWGFAQQGAIADRYFQPAAGQSSENDMYLARGGFVFLDNTVAPKSPIAAKCAADTINEKSYTDTTIADLLVTANVPWAWYSAGLQAERDAVDAGTCAPAPADCPLHLPFYPCDFDPGDVPFMYYANFVNDPVHIRDFTQLATDLENGQLPSVVFIKAIGYESEHPGYGDTISAGAAFVQGVASAILGSSAGSSTLLLVTYDESGGYFDHVKPPATNAVDNQPYGPRVPLMALGPFVRTNFVSHVQMEHPSIVKFIEWNWLGGKTGQLGTRDTTANNLGSLLDPTKTGVAVPEL